MDAHRGTYTSFQEFLSDRLFGAQAEFNRIDASNSSYYSFDKNRFVVARNTRYGQIRAFGNGSSELIPLPERLYAGGPVSLRGFSQNAAGPRDPETGYQIGGAGALINSTELRLPPPTLPLVRQHRELRHLSRHGQRVYQCRRRMGQHFSHAPARQRGLQNMRWPTRLIPTTYPKATHPRHRHLDRRARACAASTISRTRWAPGLRYHTPVGPIRFDFSYNLNPPIYPCEYQLLDSHAVSQAARFPATSGAVSRPGAAHQLLFQSGAGLLMTTHAPIRFGFTRRDGCHPRDQN